MILASHNSWSFKRPKKWYLCPFWFTAKCQSKDIAEQWIRGVRMFDLRLHFDSWGNLQVRHGIMEFNVPYNHLMNDLSFLNGKASEEDVYVRVILEQNHISKYNQTHQEWNFIKMCQSLEEYFPNIKFIEGVRKFDWQVVYQFKNKVPTMLNKYSSTTPLFGEGWHWYSKLDDWWPWLYAHLHNDHNYGKYIDYDGYLMMDFI